MKKKQNKCSQDKLLKNYKELKELTQKAIDILNSYKEFLGFEKNETENLKETFYWKFVADDDF